MAAATIAAEHYRRQVALARRIATEVGDLWSHLDPANLDLSWVRILGQLLARIIGAQNLAASDADAYLDEILAAQRIDTARAGRVSPLALSGVASDGRSLERLLYEPVIATKVAIGKGATIGSGAVIGARAMVTRDVPSNAIAVGMPAKVVRAGVKWTRERKPRITPLAPPAAQSDRG